MSVVGIFYLRGGQVIKETVKMPSTFSILETEQELALWKVEFEKRVMTRQDLLSFGTVCIRLADVSAAVFKRGR